MKIYPAQNYNIKSWCQIVQFCELSFKINQNILCKQNCSYFQLIPDTPVTVLSQVV